MAKTLEDSIMEEREELMVSPKLTKHNPPLRKTARFLKPYVPVTSTDTQTLPSNPPTLSSFPEPCSLKVSFNGWRTPNNKWKSWVDRMHTLHQSTWIKAGIEHAVLNSPYEITKHDDLILRFAEKWRRETNTFVFGFGEATITLQDMIYLGAYSTLGQSVLTPVENEESRTVLAKLYEAKVEFSRSNYRKAEQFQWLNKFNDTGSEIEHEAFLALWLSRFVFPSSFSTVVRNVFPIAVHLARGTKLALAPAVLAAIYRDLSFLKAKITDSINSNNNDEDDGKISVTVWAPFQLVQIWIWERFPKLSPNVGATFKSANVCNSKFAKWEKKKKKLQIDNGGKVFDSDSEDFCWRPYENDDLSNRENGRWIVVGDCENEELESWIRCLRVSELVGLERNCIEQYLPHRVAMQFGMDQDIPDDVARNNGSPQIGWRFYARHVADVELYLPSRFCEPCVTARYLEWWNKSTGVHSLTSLTKNCVDDESRTERFEESVSGENSSGLQLDLESRISRLEEVFEYLKAKNNWC